MRPTSKSGILIIVIAALVLALAGWALAGCGTGTTTTTVAPETTTSAATSTTVGGPAGTGGAVAVTGMVDNPMTLTVAELQKMKVETLTLDNPIPNKAAVEYTGVRFSVILEALKVQAAATAVVITAKDGSIAEVALADIQKDANSLLAFADDGTLSTVFPGLASKTWVNDVASMQFK